MMLSLLPQFTTFKVTQAMLSCKLDDNLELFANVSLLDRARHFQFPHLMHLSALLSVTPSPRLDFYLDPLSFKLPLGGD